MAAALLRNTTTRYRRLEKIFSRFCDFLLTRPSHRLILQIQIRGTWKRQTVRVEEFVFAWTDVIHVTSP